MTGRQVFDITVKRDNVDVPARIVRDIDDRALEQHRADWLPLLDGEEDASWDWRDFVEREHSEGCAYFSLWIGNGCEGLAIVRRQRPMRSEGAFGLNGCYIERLCTAPWNRMNIRNRAACERPRIKPVGKWLLWRAACLSVELGHSGRMGWHSLHGAKGDYRRLCPGLFDLGPDEDEDGLPWYEIDEAEAKRLIFDRQLIRDMDVRSMLEVPASSGKIGD